MLSEFSRGKKISVMLGVMSALFLAALDQTIVATAIPKIVQELNGLQHLSWVFTAYMLASTVSIPIYGKLSDIYGRKKFFIGGIVIFLIGSILSGLSQNMMQLIIFRGIQGIGGGALMTNAFAVIGDLFAPAERGKWQGLFGGVFGLASIIGPYLGGWLTDNANWRWVFYINIPTGILALILISLMPKISSHLKDKKIDYKAALTLSFALLSLLLAFVWGGNEYSWNSIEILGLFVFSIISFIVFVLIERKAEEPILPLDLFKNRIFLVSTIITFIVGAGMFGVIIYIPLFAQGVIGITATHSGTILIPLTVGMISASVISGQIVSRTGKYKFLTIFGFLVATGSLYFLSKLGTGATVSDLMLRMIFTGIGLGTTMPILTLIVQNAFEHSKLGVVTASSQLFRSLGSTVGTAVMVSILNNSLSSKLSDLSHDKFAQTISKINPNVNFANLDVNSMQGFLSNAAQDQFHTQMSNFPPKMQIEVMKLFNDFLIKIKGILASSIDNIFLIGAVLMLVALIASLFLKEIPLRKTHKEKKLFLEEAGSEIAIEEGQAYSGDESDNDSGKVG